MSNSSNKFSNLPEEKEKKTITVFVIIFVVCCMFPVLFLILPVIAIIYVATKKKNDNYSADHRTDYHGSGEGVREEIIANAKPVDYNKSTYEIYEELLNKKTDYSGIDKNLL